MCVKKNGFLSIFKVQCVINNFKKKRFSHSTFGFLLSALKMEGYSFDSFLIVRLILSLIVCPYVWGNLFKEVSSCPLSEEEWKHRSEKKQCKEPIPDFMCAAIENQRGRFGEICTNAGLTGKGNKYS